MSLQYFTVIRKVNHKKYVFLDKKEVYNKNVYCILYDKRVSDYQKAAKCHFQFLNVGKSISFQMY